jgi:hypothetical protein
MTGMREQEVMYCYCSDVNFVATSTVRVSQKPDRGWRIDCGVEVNLLPASSEHRSKRRTLPPAHLIRRYRRYHCPIVLFPHVWPNRGRETGSQIERPLKNPIEEASMAVITEIAPNIYRISIFAQWANLQFNHFLVKDDEPLLYHTGLRGCTRKFARPSQSSSTFPSCATSASAISSQTSAGRSMNGWLQRPMPM